jgi:two-component system response regulator RpaA
MAEANILIVEDDDIVARTVERSLSSEDFKITKANSGVEGLKAAHKSKPDLVILDVIMPGMDGYTVCREMRSDPILANVPILFLTAKVKEQDRINGFLAGADDYLSKPFNVDELILRVQAILRRTKDRNGDIRPLQDATAESQTLSESVQAILNQIHGDKTFSANRCLIVGEYVLDTQLFELHTPDKGKLRLTPVQYDLLYHLMSHPGQIFSPARLLDEVWDYPSGSGSPDLVRVHIKNLRERVEMDPGNPRLVKTVPGYGYTAGPQEEI